MRFVVNLFDFILSVLDTMWPQKCTWISVYLLKLQLIWVRHAKVYCLTKWRPILRAISSSAHLHATSPSSHTYSSIYIYRSCSASHSHTLLQAHADISMPHYTWMAYLLDEHAKLDCIELLLRSINVIEHPC